jgi:phosphopantetheinyl transferase
MEPFLQSEWIDYELEDLALRSQTVHLWQICPSKLFAHYLSVDELARYKRIVHEEAKMSYASAQGGLRKIASLYMGCLPEEVNMCRERRGKPYIRGAPEFNLSHSAGMVLAVFSSLPVGIDIESAERIVDSEGVSRKFFSAEEIRTLEMSEARIRSLTFLRYWVCKEAIVKLSGDGIYHGLRYARVDLARGRRSHGAYKGHRVWLQEFRPSADLVAALASWQPLEVNRFFRI